jgi:hypothetical protein
MQDTVHGTALALRWWLVHYIAYGRGRSAIALRSDGSSFTCLNMSQCLHLCQA